MGKSVLITGAGSGFGKGASLELAKRGHHVIGTTETEAQIDAFDSPHPNIRLEKLDITSSDVEKVSEWDIDVLVNNAGVGHSGPLAEIPMEQVRKVLSVNVEGTLALTQQVLKQMIPRRKGRILIMSSIAGLITVPTFGVYVMSKHALEAIGQTLKDEVAADGIEVAMINPGPYDTGFNDRMADSMWDWFNDSALQKGSTNTYREIGQGITAGQLDPADVSTFIADLVEAEEVGFRNLTPPDILERFQ